MKISSTIKSADWKTEKHTPIVEVFTEEDIYRVEVSVGKEIPHPNTAEHHIAWIEVFFMEEGKETALPVGKIQFTGHGEAGLTEPRATLYFKTDKKGKFYALAYCNMHGLWESQ